MSGMLVCLGACMKFRIQGGTAHLNFWFKVTLIPWFRKSLNLSKYKIYMCFFQEGLAKLSNMVDGNFFINFNSLNFFVGIHLGIT